MAVETVAILSPGSTGGAVGRELSKHGLDVITCLSRRSERTRETAEESGFREVPDMASLVRDADLMLSILEPAMAGTVAAVVSDAMKTTGAKPVFADCNAVSPQSAHVMAQAVEGVGGVFIDASIVGEPPSDGYSPRLYASGPEASILADLDGRGIRVITVGDEIGRASAIKMCHSSLAKGAIALRVAFLIAARRLDVYDEVCAELRQSLGEDYDHIQAPTGVPAKSYRWISEMEQVAATFEAVSLSASMSLGAANLFKLVGSTPLADAAKPIT